MLLYSFFTDFSLILVGISYFNLLSFKNASTDLNRTSRCGITSPDFYSGLDPPDNPRQVCSLITPLALFCPYYSVSP